MGVVCVLASNRGFFTRTSGSRSELTRRWPAALVLVVAVALVRQRWRGQRAVDTFLILPLTAPEVVMGAALLTLFLDLS